MTQDLLILGATGNVGKELIDQILKYNPDSLRVIGAASSTHFVFNPKGIAEDPLKTFSTRDYTAAREHNGLDHLMDIVAYELNGHTLTVVDVTPSTDILGVHMQARSGVLDWGVVPANKKPLAYSNFVGFRELTRVPMKYGYSCSVMAGAMAIPFLRGMPDLGEEILSLEGCLSGTNSFLAYNIQTGGKFSEVLFDAWKKGYTEPDPRDDLSGHDMAMKLVILSRTAGYRVGMQRVEIKPFIPQIEFREGESVEDFMKRAEGLDEYFRNMFEEAQSKGHTMRYVAKMDPRSKTLSVGLEEVDLTSPLGQLIGTSNKLSVYTSLRYAERPNIFEAPGAGVPLTAGNIRQDLRNLQPDRVTTLSRGF